MPEYLFDDLRELRRERQRLNVQLNVQLDAQEAEVIALIRAKGYTWEQIGQELGMTRQAAWERYGRQVEE